MTSPTFPKQERIVSRKLIEMLFGGGNSRSMSAFPLRIVYLRTGRGAADGPLQVLVSVSKRHFKHAVKRNRVKRQIREAYRHNKHLLLEALDAKPGKRLLLAFIWQSDELAGTADVAEKVRTLLQRTAERI